jgi:hypothetical protein
MAVYTCLLRICCIAANAVLLFVLRSLPSNGATCYNIVTCYLRSLPIERFIARQSFVNTQQVLKMLLGSRPRVTMEAQLEEVFSMWSAPRLYHASDSSILVQLQLSSERDIVELQFSSRS